MDASPDQSGADRPGLILGGVAAAAALTSLTAQFGVSADIKSLVVRNGMFLLTFIALFASTRRALRPDPESLGWKLIATFLLVVLVIQGFRLPAAFGHPIPLAASNESVAIQVLGSCFQIGALLVWQLAPEKRFDRIRHGLDGLLFALAVFFVLWGLVLGPAFQSDRLPIAERIIWLATFLIYDLLLGLTVYLGLPEPSRFRGPLGWFAGAFLLASLYNFHLLMGKLSGTPILPLPAGLTFAIPLAYLGAALSPHQVRSSARGGRRSRTVHLLPYLPVLGATALGVWLLITSPGAQHHTVLVWLGLSLVIVLLVRQYLALKDFSALSQHLETRVEERTQALEKAQTLLLRTERMNTLATLGAGLAHDMNNLLSAIQNWSGLVLLDLDNGRHPVRNDLVRVQEATQRAATLSSRLMALGRQDSEPPRAMDLAQELIAIQPLLQALLPRDQTLRLDGVTAPIPFLGSRGMMEQILVNLVSNARDAMPAGGAIILRARTPNSAEADAGPLLEVEDSGHGIPKELQAQVFQPFFTTKASGTGTGLGLVSVRSLLEKAGGSIAFASQAGHGTVFQIRLPGLP
jgi:signal transduction histidine kinase